MSNAESSMDDLRSTSVPTNLQGVFSKTLRSGVPGTIAALIEPELLSQLMEIDKPAVRAFRDKVLLRQWHPEDQIVPLLEPQIGLTHRLNGIVGPWAGGSIRGTWSAAFGIWRVPTVSRPSTPPGTQTPGWDSSSWVGIDGNYGSNDVLQAGVQQSVSLSGDASYVAWIEWFAPAVSNSPPYVNQTNIPNMPVSPGDEVFAAAFYVNGQGRLLFGNTTQGKYFNIVLPPPPGATFNGNSAEWIMEAAGGPGALNGEPGTSLPSFTPVVFSTAFATGAAGTPDGNPANGDTNNINLSGRNLTSVALSSERVEIDYAGAGWFQVHPETRFDNTLQQISVISRTPNNLDLFVIGFDNAVWTTFWTADGGWNPSGWFQVHPETVFDQTSEVAVVSRTPNNLDLFVIRFDNTVWTIFWTADGGWNPSGWFQVHPETVFDHTRQKISVVSRTPNNLDLFVIGFDNTVWTTFWADGNWNPNGWFQVHPETVFDQTSEVAVVSRTPNNLDLFVIRFDNTVWTIFWTADGKWNPDGWFQVHPETVFDHTRQKISVVSRTPNNLDLFVIGFDNAVWTTFWTADGNWNPDGWFKVHPETVFDHTSQQVAVVSRTPNNLDLFVIGFDNVVYSIFWSAAGGWNPGGWFQIDTQTNVFDYTKQHLAAVSRTPKNLDLFAIGFDNAVWTTFWAEDFGGWH